MVFVKFLSWFKQKKVFSYICLYPGQLIGTENTYQAITYQGDPRFVLVIQESMV